MWALGCIIYEMVTNKQAFTSESEDALKQRILTYQIPRLPTSLLNFDSLPVIQDIYSLCMQRDQNDRPSVSEILSLTALREQAKKLKIHLGAAGRSKAMTVHEI